MAIITALTLQKDKSRVNVFLDGEFSCGLEATVIYTCGLKVGLEITEERLEELRKKSEFDKAYEKALDLLNRQKYTIKALKTKLKTKGYEEETVDAVVEKLIDLKILSDLDYSISFIHSSSTKSRREIESALLSKGVSGDIIERALETEDLDDQAIAARLAEKFMRYKENSDENIKKLVAYLYRKGFKLSEVNKIAKEYGNPDFYD